ncbi:hypothetical protein V7D15_01660 [Thermoanaerobacter thermohydrosulfuricus]|uniref:Uncharacterized protein n=1 Tax=Thermoanaerobacter thermohydrosulfuricus WC1 TaxID=1198630 RepID=M8CRL9_THETY|nr:hypothetical protein [Thermoanaerobacter thermohydrosulfuricus]EMT39795.1 hypothetical protein TthWC1_0611 [Thermoanaerobacter thermohydrosulfuricus WC1]SFE15299.1 hypothetical protein SAMN04324257_00728 [Thermoanaerobacter thermohydrosulfuricus]
MIFYLTIALFITTVVLVAVIAFEVSKVQKQATTLFEINQKTQEKLTSLKEKTESIEKILENIK